MIGVPGLERTSERFRARLAQLERELGMKPLHLAATIGFETALTFDPRKKNVRSGAVGLIQFTKPVAESLGTSLFALRWFTSAIDQLEYVKRYYQRLGRRSWSSVGDVYLGTFAPAFVGAAPGTVVYKAPSQAYEQNRELDVDGKGAITVADATRGVNAILDAAAPMPEGPRILDFAEGFAVLGVVAGGVLMGYRRGYV